MTERDIRISMQPKWKAIQSAFIDMCGGDMEQMQRRGREREAMEAPLIAEYRARLAGLPKREIPLSTQ